VLAGEQASDHCFLKVNPMFIKPTKVALACAGIFATISTAHAQTNSEFNPVVVSASRFAQETVEVPAQVQVITQEDIRKSSSTNIPEILSQLGNLNVRGTNLGQSGIGAVVDMRGFGSAAQSNTLILIDGQRLSPVDTSSIHWESVALDSIERIEIIHGGGSVQFGDGAVGGVVNLITKKTDQNNYSFTGGSFGTANGTYTYSQYDDANKSLVGASFNILSSDGWRENSQSDLGSLDLKFNKKIDKESEIRLTGNYFASSYGMPGGVLGQVGTGDQRAAKFNNRGDKYVVNGRRFILGGSNQFTSNTLFDLDISAMNSETGFYTAYRDTPEMLGWGYSSRIDYKKSQYSFSPKLKTDLLSFGVLTYGLDYREANGSSVFNNGDYQKADLKNKSIYLQHKLPLTGQLDFVSGWRRETQDAESNDVNNSTYPTRSVASDQKTQSATAYDLALNYLYAPGQKFYGKINESYRFANIDEYWATNADWTGRVFTGILRPQKGHSYELGSESALVGGGKFSFSIFKLNTVDEIRYDASQQLKNINSDPIQRLGLATGLKFNFSKNLTSSTNLQLINSKYESGLYKDKRISMSPNVLANQVFNYYQGANQSYFIGVNYVGSQYYDGDSANAKSKMPAYTLFDFGFKQKIELWDIGFNIKNIFNKRYATYGGYGSGVELSPGNLGTSYYYYPGDPRAFFLTARHTFK
jgi:iron complex outermembrane receptor protein